MLNRLPLRRTTKAIAPGLLDTQHGACTGANTTTHTVKLANGGYKTDGWSAPLNVAQAFLPCVAPWDDIVLQFLSDTPRVKPQIHGRRMTTELRQ